MSPALDGPDGVLAAVSRPEAVALLFLLLLLHIASAELAAAAAAAAVVVVVVVVVAAAAVAHRLGLEHDGALGLVHQSQFAQPEADGVSENGGEETMKKRHS